MSCRRRCTKANGRGSSKDPVGLKYFRLQEPEYEAFQMIDGVNSYAEIKLHLENKFPEMELRIEAVYALVNSLHSSGLLLSDAAGQDQPLTQRRNKELKQKATSLVMSVMSLKFPGVDPERFLCWLYPKISWLFSRGATVFFGVVCHIGVTVGGEQSGRVFSSAARVQ